METLYRQGRLPGAIYSGRGRRARTSASASRSGRTTRCSRRTATCRRSSPRASTSTRDGAVLGPDRRLPRGRDGNSHIGDWQGNRTFAVMSHLPIAYPVAAGAALAYQRAGDGRVALAICGDGATSNGRWHEALNIFGIHRLPVVWVVNNNQFAYSTPNPLEFPRPDDRRAGRGVRHARRPRRRRRRPRGLRGRPPGRRARPRRRRPDADRVRLAAVEGPRRPRPGQVHAARSCSRTTWPNKDPVKNFEERLVARGRRRRREDSAQIQDARRAGSSRRVTSSRRRRRSRSRRRTNGLWVEDGYWRASPARRRDGELLMADDGQVESRRAAGHGAEPRGKRTDDGQATYLIAIAEALWEEMERDERVFLLGEDIGVYGGAFKVTEGFIDHFGTERVMDTPIAEETIVAWRSARRWRASGRSPSSSTRTSCRAGSTRSPPCWRATTTGPACACRWCSARRAAAASAPRTSTPPTPSRGSRTRRGLKVVCPSFPTDAKGLIKSAIRDDNPVVYPRAQVDLPAFQGIRCPRTRTS